MQKEDRKNIKIAFIVVGLLVIWWFIGYQLESFSFISSFVVLMVLLFSIGLGTGFIFMRLFHVERKKIGWIYHTVGLINLLSGAIGLLLSSLFNKGWTAAILSLIVGLIFFYDISRLKNDANGKSV